MWEYSNVLKSGPNKIYGRQPLKNLKGYGMLPAFKKFEVIWSRSDQRVRNISFWENFACVLHE